MVNPVFAGVQNIPVPNQDSGGGVERLGANQGDERIESERTSRTPATEVTLSAAATQSKVQRLGGSENRVVIPAQEDADSAALDRSLDRERKLSAQERGRQETELTNTLQRRKSAERSSADLKIAQEQQAKEAIKESKLDGSALLKEVREKGINQRQDGEDLKAARQAATIEGSRADDVKKSAENRRDERKVDEQRIEATRERKARSDEVDDTPQQRAPDKVEEVEVDSVAKKNDEERLLELQREKSEAKRESSQASSQSQRESLSQFIDQQERKAEAEKKSGAQATAGASEGEKKNSQEADTGQFDPEEAERKKELYGYQAASSKEEEAKQSDVKKEKPKESVVDDKFSATNLREKIAQADPEYIVNMEGGSDAKSNPAVAKPTAESVSAARDSVTQIERVTKPSANDLTGTNIDVRA